MSVGSERLRLSANTGYLWQELHFLERIRRAADVGFDAVEFHDEAQSCDRFALKDVLAETGLPVLGINIRMGDTIGTAAIPVLADRTKRNIEEAVEIASDIGAANLHVLAGVAEGEAARQTCFENLRFALDNSELTILIEPVCWEQCAGFFLRTVSQASDVLREIDHPALKILFDCYHVLRESGQLLERFRAHVNQIGHVQIAAAEQRSEPFPGELDYRELLPAFRQAGYTGAFGCEYRPRSTTDEGLAWREQF